MDDDSSISIDYAEVELVKLMSKIAKLQREIRAIKGDGEVDSGRDNNNGTRATTIKPASSFRKATGSDRYASTKEPTAAGSSSSSQLDSHSHPQASEGSYKIRKKRISRGVQYERPIGMPMENCQLILRCFEPRSHSILGPVKRRTFNDRLFNESKNKSTSKLENSEQKNGNSESIVSQTTDDVLKNESHNQPSKNKKNVIFKFIQKKMVPKENKEKVDAKHENFEVTEKPVESSTNLMKPVETSKSPKKDRLSEKFRILTRPKKSVNINEEKNIRYEASKVEESTPPQKSKSQTPFNFRVSKKAILKAPYRAIRKVPSLFGKGKEK
ncbi:hypothetical protein TKK_0000241 [Trichogramma kaykai]